MSRNFLLAIAVLLATDPALAQRSPDTSTMDRLDGVSHLGLDLGLVFLEPPPYEKAVRFEPYGQLVSRRGLGFYGSLPIAYSSGGEGSSTLEPGLTIGNAELGGLFVRSRRTTSWVFRGGITLPIAGSGSEAVATNVLAGYARLTDLALSQPDTLYLRLAVSPLYHKDKLFLRADIGLDLGLETAEDPNDAVHLFRLNFGGGADLGLLAVGLELVNLVLFDGVDGNEQFLHSIAFTMRFMGKSLQPMIGLGTPIDESARETVDLFLAFGIQYVP